MTFQPNQVVTIHYKVTDNEQNLVDSANADTPFSFISGRQQILPKLEKALSKMKFGERATVVLSPAEAYGEYTEEGIKTVQRKEFPPEAEIEVGMQFMASTPNGQQIPVRVDKINGDDITINFNHILAGKTLTFDVELVSARDATPEELDHGHAHGAGGHNH